MTLEILQNEKITAIKNKNKLRTLVLSGMIDAIKKASMTNKGRIEITESLVDETLLKYKKMIQEMIDTCPANRTETLAEYNNQMAIVTEFAPTLITDETEIRYLILDIASINNDVEFIKANRGYIMKIVAPILKGKANMGIVSKVLGGMLK